MINIRVVCLILSVKMRHKANIPKAESLTLGHFALSDVIKNARPASNENLLKIFRSHEYKLTNYDVATPPYIASDIVISPLVR